MKAQRIVVTLAALALVVVLAACGKPSTYAQDLLEDASGIKVTAENASSDNEATTKGAITVKEGDVIVISPYMEKGSFHLTITSEDGEDTVFNDYVSGRVLWAIEADPGVYDVTTSGNNATGWMTVFAQSSNEFAEQNETLSEELENVGADKDAIEKVTDTEG